MSSLSLSELALRRASARDALPDEPVRASDELLLERFEVALAYNLDPPYRHAQDIFWLEAMAADATQAAHMARAWVLQSAEPFETTGYVRWASPHPASIGFDHERRPLQVMWNLPVVADMPAHTVLRDPVTGLRVGFVAHPEAERRWLPQQAAGAFKVVSRKPTSSSDPAALAPLCVRV